MASSFLFRPVLSVLSVVGFLLLCALCVLCGESSVPSVCSHPPRGESLRVSLDAVRRAQEDVKKRLAWAVGEASRLSADSPFESGLPACQGRARRTVRVPTPPPLAGKTIVFAPAERMPPGDLRVATSARRLAEVRADAMADRALARRLGVRCAPTIVTVRSEVELELVEDP